MDIKQQLETDLINAMRSNDEVAKRTIRLALSTIKLMEVDKSIKLDDAAVLAIIQKEIKTRRESITDAEKADRKDLVEKNLEEITVLEKYLPKQVSEEELRRVVMEGIAEVNAAGVSDMGKVMKAILPKIQGRAPNDQVSKVVKELLNS